MKERSHPTVSVAMITYNHEAFIGEAIESVVGQEADFDIELVIGEDCSPDRTGEIVAEYQERYPDLIRTLPRKENIGAFRNFIDTILNCRGEYLALLDGDDYWTSNRKLARQVEVLDDNPRLSTCFHAVEKRQDGGPADPLIKRPHRIKPVYGLEDLANDYLIQTCSVVFRRSMFDGFPDWWPSAPCGDWPLFFIHAERGDIAYIDEVMSVHRIHSNGAWTQMRGNRAAALESAIQMLDIFIEHLGPGRNDAFVNARYRRYYDLAHHYVEEGDRRKARLLMRALLRECGYAPRVYPTEPLKLLANLVAPPVFRFLQGHWRRLRDEPPPFHLP